MKKSLIIMTVVGLSMAFVSCKKDRVCECTYQDGDKTSTEYKDVSKSFVEDEAGCVSYTETHTDSDGDVNTYTVICEIK